MGNDRASSAAFVVGCAWDPSPSRRPVSPARGQGWGWGRGRGRVPPLPPGAVRSSRWLRSTRPWTCSPLRVSGSPLPSRHHPNGSGFEDKRGLRTECSSHTKPAGLGVCPGFAPVPSLGASHSRHTSTGLTQCRLPKNSALTEHLRKERKGGHEFLGAGDSHGAGSPPRVQPLNQKRVPPHSTPGLT